MMSYLVYVIELVTIMFFFFFNDTATTEIYTLSLHDALPISTASGAPSRKLWSAKVCERCLPTFRTSASTRRLRAPRDRKSTRLNSSHANISYAVFCLKKKKSKLTRSHTRQQA